MFRLRRRCAVAILPAAATSTAGSAMDRSAGEQDKNGVVLGPSHRHKTEARRRRPRLPPCSPPTAWSATAPRDDGTDKSKSGATVTDSWPARTLREGSGTARRPQKCRRRRRCVVVDRSAATTTTTGAAMDRSAGALRGGQTGVVLTVPPVQDQGHILDVGDPRCSSGLPDGSERNGTARRRDRQDQVGCDDHRLLARGEPLIVRALNGPSDAADLAAESTREALRGEKDGLGKLLGRRLRATTALGAVRPDAELWRRTTWISLVKSMVVTKATARQQTKLPINFVAFQL